VKWAAKEICMRNIARSNYHDLHMSNQRITSEGNENDSSTEKSRNVQDHYRLGQRLRVDLLRASIAFSNCLVNLDENAMIHSHKQGSMLHGNFGELHGG
jgi:hypothetical protein